MFSRPILIISYTVLQTNHLFCSYNINNIDVTTIYFKFNDTKFIYLQLFIIVSIAVYSGLKTVHTSIYLRHKGKYNKDWIIEVCTECDKNFTVITVKTI